MRRIRITGDESRPFTTVQFAPLSFSWYYPQETFASSTMADLPLSLSSCQTLDGYPSSRWCFICICGTRCWESMEPWIGPPSFRTTPFRRPSQRLHKLPTYLRLTPAVAQSCCNGHTRLTLGVVREAQCSHRGRAVTLFYGVPRPVW